MCTLNVHSYIPFCVNNMCLYDKAGTIISTVVRLLIALTRKTYDIFYFRIFAWMHIPTSMLRPLRSKMHHMVAKIGIIIYNSMHRVIVAARNRQLKISTIQVNGPRTPAPGTTQQIHESIKVLLDVDYSLYVHHIFTVWVLYFIFFCFLILTTFTGSRALYLLCISPIIAGPMNLFARKYLFYNKFFIYHTTIRIFDYSYATSFKLLDKGLFEILGPYGAINTISKAARRVTKMQTGLLYHNTGILILGAIFLLMFGSVFLYAWMHNTV